MQLVQLFLPLYDNAGRVFPKAMVDAVRAELAERFGGVTAYVRSPAVGAWEDDDGVVRRDDVVLVEVMCDALEREWWRAFARRLAERFAQEEILVRALGVERLA